MRLLSVTRVHTQKIFSALSLSACYTHQRPSASHSLWLNLFPIGKRSDRDLPFRPKTQKSICKEGHTTHSYTISFSYVHTLVALHHSSFRFLKTLLPPPFIIFVILSPMYIFSFLFYSFGRFCFRRKSEERESAASGRKPSGLFFGFFFVFITIIVIISYTGFRCSRSRE